MANEKIPLNEIVVQRKIILKNQKEMTKWGEVKNKKYLIELKKNEFNKWVLPQFKDVFS